MTISVVLLLVFLHFIGDFVLQEGIIRVYKSSNNKLLAIHCILYALPFSIISLKLALVTSFLHFLSDYTLTDLSTKFWSDRDRSKYSLLQGFDQWLHLVVLLVSAYVLL